MVNYKKASTYYLVGNVFNKGIAFLTVPIFTRILSTSDYGIVTTYNSWIAILCMILGFALHMSVRMAAIDYKEKLNEFMSSIILFTTLSSLVIVIVISLVIKLGHVNADIFLVVICLLQAYSFAVIEDYSCYLMMQYRYKVRTIFMILPNFISVIVSIVAILFVLETDLYLGRIIPTALINIIFGSAIVILALFKGKFSINRQYIKYGLTISAPLIVHGIALNILSQSDRIMITYLANSSQTGIYSLIYNFSMIATVITTTLEGVWVPWFLMKLKNQERNEINMIGRDYIHLMTYVMGCLILVAPEIVKMLANRDYWEGINIIPPVILSNYFIFAYSLYVNIEHYYKKTQYITLNTLIAAALNIVLNLIFIPKYGYIAAAYTTVISYLVSFVFHSRYARKLEQGLYPIEQFVEPLIHLLVITVLFYVFKDNGIMRWSLMVVYFGGMFYREKNRIIKYFPEIQYNAKKRR